MLTYGPIALIPFARRHVGLLYGWLNDIGLRAAMGEVVPLTEIQVEQYFDRASRDQGHAAFIIFDVQARLEVGFITLRDIGPVHRRGELSVAVARPDKRRQGFARHAVDGIVHHGFRNLGLKRVWLTVRVDNAGAIALYEKCGFAHEGRLRSHFFHDGQWIDAFLMARVQP